MVNEKIRTIQEQIKKQNLRGLLIGNYGFTATDDLLYYLLLRTPEYAVCFIPVVGKPTLYTISFEAAELGHVLPEMTVKPMVKSISELVEIHVPERVRVGLRHKTTPIEVFNALKKTPRARWQNFTGAESIVAIKMAEEQRSLRHACTITDKIFSELISAWKQFRTEANVAAFIRERTAHHGAEIAFPPIVASGKNAANPHYQPRNKKIQKGFCVIDMGVRYRGYCSDMTRTIFVGKPAASEQVLYNRLLSVQTQTINRVRDGVTTAELDRFCRESLGNELNKQFIHGLGHGLGTQVHEWPSVSERADVTLQPNMLITVEPGVYLQGKYGIRIEDDVLVRAGKSLVLTKSTKNLLVVT